MTSDRDSPFSLHGKVAVVTGASRGIGAAIAHGLKEAGARVIAVSRSQNTVQNDIEFEACDLANPLEPAGLITRIATRTDKIDVLVNAAAVSFARAVDSDDDDEILRMKKTFDVDVIAAYSMTLKALPFFRAAGGGSIINITSINSVRGFPGNPGYVAAKAALAGLTRALAVDLAADNIRVNSIAPGYVRTAMTEASYSNSILNAQRRRHTLLNRWGEPGDIAGAAVFLSSDASAYITGQEFFVDGGWTVNGLLSLE